LTVRTEQGRVAGRDVQRLLGLWVIWHSFGGLDGLIEQRVISRTGVFVQRKEFREVFGVDIDNFMPDAAVVVAGQLVDFVFPEHGQPVLFE
jgi:hypothetical protein